MSLLHLILFFDQKLQPSIKKLYVGRIGEGKNPLFKNLSPCWLKFRPTGLNFNMEKHFSFHWCSLSARRSISFYIVWERANYEHFIVCLRGRKGAVRVFVLHCGRKRWSAWRSCKGFPYLSFLLSYSTNCFNPRLVLVVDEKIDQGRREHLLPSHIWRHLVFYAGLHPQHQQQGSYHAFLWD